MLDLIATTDKLAEACTKLKRAGYLTVDTEFIRDQTYWPELCLVQIAGPDDDVVLVDPLAEGLKLDPLYELLTAKRVTKVLHAARQDIEIFHHQAGLIPAPLFDTQVAAMVLGFGDSVGYEQLVKRTLNAQVDKSSRFTDWRRRPLSEQQLAYAKADVSYLRGAYDVLSARLKESGRESWVGEEMAVLLDPKTYSLEPEDAWRRIKTKSLSRRALAVLIETAAWREREAQSRNVPRARVMKDDSLLEIAMQAPESREALAQLRAVPSGFSNSRAAKPLLEAVARGLALPKDSLPIPPRTRHSAPGAAPTVELLKVLLKVKCEENGVAAKLVATSEDIEAIAADDEADVPALSGWRRDLFGADALALKHGEIGLAMKNGALALITLKPRRREQDTQAQKRGPAPAKAS